MSSEEYGVPPATDFSGVETSDLFKILSEERGKLHPRTWLFFDAQNEIMRRLARRAGLILDGE